MASGSMSEVDYLITCPICSCEYDELNQDLTPKFLSCSHTLCLQCLKKLQSSFFLACPLCRKIICPTGTLDISQVPTNTYALHILKTVKAERSIKPVKKCNKPYWCLTCGSVGKIECSGLHSTLDLTASTMASLEALLTMRESFSKMKQPIKTKIEESIQKEKEVQSYIDKLLKSLKSFEADVKKMEEESNVRLIELNILLSSPDFSTRTKEEENEVFLSQLSSLTSSSQPKETVEMLKQKMEESFKEMETKLSSSSAELTEIYDLVHTTRITVQIFKDELDSPSTLLPCSELFEKGFISKWKDWSTTKKIPPGRRDIFLLSHLIFSIRNRHLKPPVMSTATAPPVDPIPSSARPPSWAFPHLYGVPIGPPAAEAREPVPRPRLAPKNKFFALTIKNSGIVKGRVHIQPVPWYPDFITPWGLLCLTSAQTLSQPAGKAVPGCYVQIPLALDAFSLGNPPSNLTQLARGPFAIGLMKKNGVKLSDPPKWTLIFFLDKCQDPKYEIHLKSMNPEPLFGYVVEGMEALNALSGTSVADRLSYTFTIEYI